MVGIFIQSDSQQWLPMMYPCCVCASHPDDIPLVTLIDMYPLTMYSFSTTRKYITLMIFQW
jgi:hypothetical protein